MTHPGPQIDRALALHTRGHSAREISVRLGIPRRTVSDWVAGRLPRQGLGRGERCRACGGPTHSFEDLPPSYAYLLGLYLGDGSIASHARGVYKLRINLDASYPTIIERAASAMSQVLPKSKVNTWLRSYGDVEVYSYSKVWPCLFPQHAGEEAPSPDPARGLAGAVGSGKPELVLRGLIHSDGCRFLNTGRRWSHPRYAFSNLSPDIRRIFTHACDLLGLRWTTSGRTVYVSRKADVAEMDRFVGPKT